MTKLNVLIMGQNCEKYIGMCLKSVEGADNITYCDGGSSDGTLHIVNKFENARRIAPTVINNNFNQEDILMNSKQKNFFLDYLKEKYMGEWVLYLDADEVLDDFSKLREFIDNPPENLKPLISVKMRHFENNLGFEDATVPEHYVPNRLFKVNENMYFPEGEHTILWIKKNGVKISEEETANYCAKYKGVTIWHLAYCSGIWDFRKRYLNHLRKSEIHPKEFMDKWYFSHLFGIYPAKSINAAEIPDIILKEFLINPDKIYFMNRRNLETKHFIMAKQWLNYFKPKNVLDLGCGLGLYGYAIDSYGVDYQGLELSKWAIENTIYRNLKIKQGDVTEQLVFKDFDLVLCVDLLEHLEEKDLDKTLELIKDYGKNFLFSIPFIGDPNLETDPTHKIKKEKQWWINKLTNNFKIKEAPKHFTFHKQMLIGEPK